MYIIIVYHEPETAYILAKENGENRVFNSFSNAWRYAFRNINEDFLIVNIPSGVRNKNKRQELNQ